VGAGVGAEVGVDRTTEGAKVGEGGDGEVGKMVGEEEAGTGD